MHSELLKTVFKIHLQIFLPCSFIGGDRHTPLLLALHLPPWFHFWNEWVINQRCLFKPCFDSQPMAFPSEINYSPAAPHCPSPWPSNAQHLHIPNLCFNLLFHHNYPPTMQYNWLESETQCALMHSILNSLRDRLWFNRLKDTETWSWNVM